MFVSIIIPIYNAEKYLVRCIESVLNQTFQHFELILVNDGSTDKSELICDKYVSNDHRVRVFHTMNNGVGSARNLGIEKAGGEWLFFMDSDDWIDKHFLSAIVQSKFEKEIVFFDFYRTTAEDSVKIVQDISNLDRAGIVAAIFSRKTMGSVWNKIFKRDLFLKHKIKFPQDIHYCEDQYTLIALLAHTEHIGYCPEAYYHYFHNTASITGTFNEQYFKKVFEYVNFIKKNENILITNSMQHENNLFIKSDMLYSGLYSNKQIRHWERESNKYLWKSGLSFFTKLRLMFVFSKLGFLVPLTLIKK